MPQLFSFANLWVLPFWALMIGAPRARLTARVVGSPLIVLPLIAAYAALVLPSLSGLLPIVARPELGAVATLLGTPAGATAGWTHFLAFDLWVGRFIVLDARERSLPSIVLSPILLLTLLLGPLGLGAYLALRAGALERVRGAWRLAFESSPALTWLGTASLLAAVVGLGLQAVDPRQLAGASVWLKPTKFGVSIAVFSFTLAWLLRAISVPQKQRRRLVTAIASLLLLELVIICGQAARGVASHFNMATLLDALLFQVMGVAILAVTVAVARLGIYALRTRYENSALGTGIRLGFAIMVFGCAIGAVMPRPTPTQLETLQRGRPTPLIGSHTVGVEDDTHYEVPLTRWNTQSGDLRVSHFIGLHALQVLPLIGLWLSRRRRLDSQLATKFTWIAGAGYFGLTLTTLVQALRGVPLFALDTPTLVLGAAVALGCSAAAALATYLSRLNGSIALRSRRAA